MCQYRLIVILSCAKICYTGPPMPDATLSRLINAAVAAQQRGVPAAVLGACAAILESSAAGGRSESDTSGTIAPPLPEHLLPVVGTPVALDEISDDLGRAIRRWLGRRDAAEVVREVRLWYAQRGLVEPPAATIEALVASIQQKREAKRSAALKAWERKTPAERKAWVAKLGRGPKAGAKRAKR